MVQTVRRRAAQYLRMSTEHQQYSTENQSDAIQVYAALRNFDIVATYRDDGKSGLSIEGRPGLQELLRDAQATSPNFDVIIVYDVSRWGRFQDADESAYYEHLCKRAGISLEYCAEPFTNDGSPLSAVLKGLKRAMAAEYSRELSEKVWIGQKRLIERGYRQGGSAGYGLRRFAIAPDGGPRTALTYGQQKNLHTDRVILVPGPAQEVETVRWIYRKWIDGWAEHQIVNDLNRRGVKTDFDRPFTKMVVHAVLTSEKYAGANVWNRTSVRLKRGYRRNAPENWVRTPDAFEALIDRKTFDEAQACRRARAGRLSDEEILGPLRKILKDNGYITHGLIEAAGRYPTVSACVKRFGSIRATYERLGYVNPKDHRYVEVNQRVRQMMPQECMRVFEALAGSGLAIIPETVDRFVMGGRSALTVTLSRYRNAKDVTRGWHVVADAKWHTDIFIMARLDKENAAVMDYFVLPLAVLAGLHFNLTERKAAQYEHRRATEPAGLVSLLRDLCASEPA